MVVGKGEPPFYSDTLGNLELRPGVLWEAHFNHPLIPAVFP